MMKAILVNTPGNVEQLTFGEYPTPQPGPNEILVKVAATALNRADLLQREGKYPPPPGASPILGLEIAGTVTQVGADVAHWKLGDRVCALLPGGGYAQYATVHKHLALPIPENLSFIQAAAIPEVFLTAFQTLNWLAKLQAGETALIHAGASGVGTAAIQLARFIGATCLVTASAGKHELCQSLGASACIDYKMQDFAVEVLQLTQNRGVDVILDCIGGPYLEKNIQSLAVDGRLIEIAVMGGNPVASLNMAAVLMKRIHIQGSTLRARELEYKIRLTQQFADLAWSSFGNGKLYPVIAATFPWAEVKKAHQMMEDNSNAGKIVLAVD
jgi:putative PIG3 family NAD(P)H quinone oxidoreductase